tara:strand:- start:43 stop:390 length:348 start_codon:yes stop_codon:yes gene_type:complete
MTILDNELPDNLLGSTSNMKFTLDDTGYVKLQKQYYTDGFDQDVTGTITDPDGTTWKIEVETSAGSDHNKSGVATGQSEKFTLKTNAGKTTITLKLWAENGAASAGAVGHMTIKY